jgi:SlyX protein
MHDERLIDIESKLAHQENLLAELNSALTSQQAQIMRLETLCETLIEQIRSMSDGTSSADAAEERPPHY